MRDVGDDNLRVIGLGANDAADGEVSVAEAVCRMGRRIGDLCGVQRSVGTEQDDEDSAQARAGDLRMAEEDHYDEQQSGNDDGEVTGRIVVPLTTQKPEKEMNQTPAMAKSGSCQRRQAKRAQQ